MSPIVQSATSGGQRKTCPRKLYRYKPVPPADRRADEAEGEFAALCAKLAAQEPSP